jgi:TolB-like protein
MIITLLPAITNSQEKSNIKIAVIQFKNSSQLDIYEYLISSIQNSIHSSLSQYKEIGLISNTKSNEISNKYDYSFDSLEDMSKALRFAYDTRATIILSGEYIIKEETDEVIIRVFAFSIAEKRFIYAKQFLGNMGTGIFDLIDRLSMETTKEIIKNKEIYEKFIQKMLSDLKPPEYIQHPKVVDSVSKGIMVEWITDKDTVSSLYVSPDKDFDINNADYSIIDLSTDGKRHYVIIDYDKISKKDKYYFKSKDIDFIDNKVVSKTGEIDIKEVKKLINLTKDNLIKSMYDNISQHNFQKAHNDNKSLLTMINDYSSFIEDIGIDMDILNSLNTQLNKASTIEETLKKAETNLTNNDYKTALEGFQEVLEYLIENPIEDVLPIEYIEERIHKIETAIMVKQLIEEGDKLTDNKKYSEAREKYNQAYSLIKDKNLHSIIPIEDVDNRLRKLPEVLGTYYYVNLSLGIGYADLGINNNIYQGIAPSVELSLTIRIDRVFSLGFGISQYFIQGFSKVSILNTTSIKPTSHEIFIKPTIYMNVLFGFTIGAGGSIGYIIGFNNKYGLIFDAEFIYDFLKPSYTILGKVGFVIFF